MWFMRCNKDIPQCTCLDMNERLKSATKGGHFAYKKCAICDKHYELCKCENPQWVIQYKEANLMTINKFGQRSFVRVKGLKERLAEKEIQMREIKFRAWDTRRQKMWSAEEMGRDQLTLSPDGRGFLNVNGMSTKFSQWMSHLVPEQFTGLKDKNGTEIYEGDIVKCLCAIYGDTTWWDGIVTWQPEGSVGWCIEPLPKDKHRGRYGMNYSYEWKVIGDIHTKPELLEQENG